ncbi:hypothetical protein L1987_30809 [Smallanthus sonchifolius]|uniref:Uncharacterized protein n=1 Tax=Smallanthus sonchifolius TaxID=185202 RepID=A0ACB9I509_9ASTR|nr:hypothetical protein L1987_30809 [Smallanthus sonchifolius]
MLAPAERQHLRDTQNPDQINCEPFPRVLLKMHPLFFKFVKDPATPYLPLPQAFVKRFFIGMAFQMTPYI